MLKTVFKINNFIGRAFLKIFENVGKIIIFLFLCFYWCFKKPIYYKQLLNHILDIGYYSLPVVGLTTFFSGMVLALQTYSGFDNFNDETTISKIVLTSILRELGPVLAGLMVCGRVGAKMAAEIATMRVSNQIDALETLDTRPIQFLISTRLLAALVSVPFLVLIGNIIGVFGGFVVAILKLDFNPILYMTATIENFHFIMKLLTKQLSNVIQA